MGICCAWRRESTGARATDATAGLQAAGSSGLVTNLSGSATDAPIVLALDNLLVTRP